MYLSGLIARQRRQIASVRDAIPISGHVNTPFRTKLTLLGIPIAHLPREAMQTRVAAVYEVAIASGLITLRRSLITIGRSLITIGCGLIAIGRGLIAIGCGLVGVSWCPVIIRAARIGTSEMIFTVSRRPQTGAAGLLRCLDRPIRGLHGTTA